MPSSARILRFPRRASPEFLPAEQAQETVRKLLAVPAKDRSAAALERVASHPDLLLAFCAVLSEQVDVLPSNVGVEAAQLYEALARTPQSVGLFDEKQYFMGETALLAGRC